MTPQLFVETGGGPRWSGYRGRIVIKDPVLDDPGELLRFWLWHRHHDVRGFKITDLAKFIKAKPAAVSAWLTRPLAIPTPYWNAIARYFERPDYHALETEARALWDDAKERRGYAPLYESQVKRRRRRRVAAA